MNLVRSSPLRELEEMSDRLNRVFTESDLWRTNDTKLMTETDWTPAVEISEIDGEFQMMAELPGVKKEDVKITLENRVLTIAGERKQRWEKEGRKIHRLERSYGRFARSFILPDLVDDAKVWAEFKDGVFHLHLPKSEQANPKAIDVKVA